MTTFTDGLALLATAIAVSVCGPAVAQSLPVTGRPVAATRAVAVRPAASQATATQEVASGLPLAIRASADRAIARALQYLASVQAPDGAWQAMGKSDVAITAIVGQAFAQDPNYGPGHAVVRKALGFVLATRRSDGGLYAEGSSLARYHTSIALMFLSNQPPGNKNVDEAVRGAQDWLENVRWIEGRGGADGEPFCPGDPDPARSSLAGPANAEAMLSALRQSGLAADDPAYQKAVRFINRCQEPRNSQDRSPTPAASESGGVYAGIGDSEGDTDIDEEAERRLFRSYGSMTYDGFKSLLHARVDHSDPRVRAAFDWIRSHYTLDENPNMPGGQSRDGLFYYYHVFAKTLNASGQETIVDQTGKPHAWRQDLILKLTSLQRPDGSWRNEADRWYEGDPHYVTGLAVLALQAALRPQGHTASR